MFSVPAAATERHKPAIDVKSLHAKIGEWRWRMIFWKARSPGGIAERKAMIDREHDLPITKQAAALKISRGSVYYLPRPVSATDLEIMRRLDRAASEFPFAVRGCCEGLLAAEGCKIAVGMSKR